MPTAATAEVSIDLPQSEVERIVRDATLMRMDGVDADEVERWMRAEVAKAITVR